MHYHYVALEWSSERQGSIVRKTTMSLEENTKRVYLSRFVDLNNTVVHVGLDLAVR